MAKSEIINHCVIATASGEIIRNLTLPTKRLQRVLNLLRMKLVYGTNTILDKE